MVLCGPAYLPLVHFHGLGVYKIHCPMVPSPDSSPEPGGFAGVCPRERRAECPLVARPFVCRTLHSPPYFFARRRCPVSKDLSQKLCALRPPRPALSLVLGLVEALWAPPRSIGPRGDRAPSSCCADAVPWVGLCFPPCSGRFLGRRWEVPG